MPKDPLQDAIISYVVDRHMSLPEAAREVRKLIASTGGDTSAVDAALSALQKDSEQNIVVPNSVINDETFERWYHRPADNGQWYRYRESWATSGKPGLDELDRSTTAITQLLANPRGTVKRKGLVMGNVQSGKTGNFAGVIAKAADAEYRLVIVMGGLYNNLRQQTQARLFHDLFHDPSWDLLTGPRADLPHIEFPTKQIRVDRFTAAVVKKNAKRLQNLLDALRSLPEETRRRLPILIVDDEADQATPNSPTRAREVSAINRLMRDIWSEVRVGTYLAYTATPFANVLMDPDEDEELFPSDFITMLTPGPTYFGAERLFGIAEAVEEGEQRYSDGLDMIRQVPDDERASLQPPSSAEDRMDFVPPLVPSLADALRWYLLATAIRRLRGDHDHSSMLIHTTHYAAPHVAMQQELSSWLEWQSSAFEPHEYKSLWETEVDRVRNDPPRQRPTWPQIESILPSVIESARVVVDNGISYERLDYSSSPGQVVIAIGGGTLSRGLTLEGLVVSYFTRTTNTYDTLMQMGRWFGYRDGYEDLPRLWVSKDLDKDYAFLARVERDLRDEIASFEGSEFTPKQVGVKVRSHPGRLEITSVGRMKQAQTVELSLSGVARQTFLLDASSPNIAASNLSHVERLLSGRLRRESDGRLMARDMDSRAVVDFINGFTSHDDQRILQSPQQKELMASWIRQYASHSAWTVMVADNTASGAAERLGTLEVAGHTVRMVNRAPLKGSTPDRLDFKAVMSPGDWVADIRSDLSGKALPSNPTERRRARRIHAQDKGLVVIYPISPSSKPSKGATERIEIPVDEAVISFAIIFPHVRDTDGSQGTFVSVRPNPTAVVDDYVEVELGEDNEDGGDQ